jgi:ssDNA-binding Zn-finger/Zn-ribbon topoisomerase 1
MGIKCSLLGHKFSGTEVEEEREEQGSEVVITIEEVEVCERCGKRRVVSENKEVTSLAASEEGEPDAEADPAAASAPEPEPDEPEAAETDAQAPPPGPDMNTAEDDAELLDAGGDGADTTTDDESAPGPEPEPDIATAGETGVEDEPTAEDDGAVILDDNDEEPEREPGEWPEDESAPEAESEPDPETIEQAATEAVEDSEDPEPAAGQAETEEWPDEYGYEEESATAPEVDWPEEDEGDGEDWEPGESLTQRIDSDVEPAGAATVTVPEGEFYCPECEFTTLVEESSLRAGDFCPSCHRGSLEHRAEDATRKE